VRQVRARFESVLEERSRLAREMHDTIIQGCTGVSAVLEAVSMDGSNSTKSASLMDFARLQLRTTINEAREAIWNLRRTDDDAGTLGQKLEGIARQVSSEFNLPIDCSIHGTPFSLSHPVAHDLLMVAREGIFNAALHGHPEHVGMTLTYENRELTLCLSDDGCGFDPRTMTTQNGHHFGLRGMRERIERSGGEFYLSSTPGRGVQIEVRLPRKP
jgi:signal transduction histidine kinase